VPSPIQRGDSDAELIVLATDSGRSLLDEVAAITAPAPSEIARWRRSRSAEVVSAALRLADCRRRARAKFSRADEMWLEPTALEQATAEIVARHKAERFAGTHTFDLCCGIGGDSIAIAARARSLVAVDLDAGMCQRTRWNTRVYELTDRVLVARGRAESPPLSDRSHVHIDPDRRARGRRAHRVEGYSPSPAELRSLSRGTRGGAIKLSAASDFDAQFGDRSFEIELISLRGECKEATVWFGDRVLCARRATILPQNRSWTDRDGSLHAEPGVHALSSWIYDPDPALVRSGLFGAFAVEHGLARVASNVDFMTSDVRVETAFLAAFAVQDVLPLDLKKLRRYIRAHGLGPLEIKVRGCDIRPESLRTQLRPPGPNAATLLIFPGRDGTRAVVANRWRGG
jgi:hypothetical protein